MLMIQDPFIALSLSALFGLLLGLIVSRGSDSAGYKKQLEEERQNTFEKEKEISGEIYGSLYELHHGLVKTIKSYDSAVKTVLDKLPTPIEKIQELGLQDNVPLTIKLDDSEVVKSPEVKSEVVNDSAEAAELVDAEFSSEAHDLAQSKKLKNEAAEKLKMEAAAKAAKAAEEPQLGSVSGDDWSQPIANP